MDSALRSYVLLRDGGCCARLVTSKLDAHRWPMMADLPDPGPCRNAFGEWQDPCSLMSMTVDHVEMDGEMSYGSKPADDAGHLWTLCWHHHIGSHWATRADVRAAARLYIPAANDAARAHGWPPEPAAVR